LANPTQGFYLIGADLDPIHIPATTTEHVEAQGVIAGGQGDRG
jgi:hypothetical protein